MLGDWMLMGHMMLWGIYDTQSGPRGDDKAFVEGMLMGEARRDFSSGDTLNLRAMLSPDPFMGKSGYPLLLASGETANGVTPLIDRQHPHDLFMELAASWAHRLDSASSIFLYAADPGEPALGPPPSCTDPAAWIFPTRRSLITGSIRRIAVAALYEAGSAIVSIVVLELCSSRFILKVSCSRVQIARPP